MQYQKTGIIDKEVQQQITHVTQFFCDRFWIFIFLSFFFLNISMLVLSPFYWFSFSFFFLAGGLLSASSCSTFSTWSVFYLSSTPLADVINLLYTAVKLGVDWLSMSAFPFAIFKVDFFYFVPPLAQGEVFLYESSSSVNCVDTHITHS